MLKFSLDRIRHGPLSSRRSSRPKCIHMASLPPISQPRVLTGSCYEEVVEELASRAMMSQRESVTSDAGSNSNRRLLVGIAGAPGSSKTTLAALVQARINLISGLETCVTLPMDGFHLSKPELGRMPNREEAFKRRGSPWTFDAHAFVTSVQRAKRISDEDLPHSVPSFDHAVGDPCEGDIKILPSHRIVLVEGNYLLLDEEPWAELRRGCFDDTWFVDIGIEEAMDRVFQRQVEIGLLTEESRARIEGNDRLNASLLIASKGAAKVPVPSSIPFRPFAS